MAGRLVLSTCGTSLLTHGATAGERRRLVACANAGTGELHGRARALIDRRVALAAARLEGDVAAARAASAELNAIVALAGGTNRWARGHGRSDHHRLVHSDTAQGEEAARLLAAWLVRQGREVRLQTAAGLRTSSLAGFRAATAELAGALAAELPARRARGEEIVFNLTGGFKALHAVVQAMGARFADRVVCLFEGTDELLEIPRTL